jgi:hypothetical protein
MSDDESVSPLTIHETYGLFKFYSSLCYEQLNLGFIKILMVFKFCLSLVRDMRTCARTHTHARVMSIIFPNEVPLKLKIREVQYGCNYSCLYSAYFKHILMLYVCAGTSVCGSSCL